LGTGGESTLAADASPLERLLRIIDREQYIEARRRGGVDTPFERQSLALYRCFKQYVSASLDAAYAGPTSKSHAVRAAEDVAEAAESAAGAMAADAELVGFVEQLLGTLGTTAHLVARRREAGVVVVRELPPPAFRELCECVMATLMERVTAGHEHVGHLAPYARDVRFCAWRWPVGEATGNKQGAISQAVLTSFTFMPMPMLLAEGDGWAHLFEGVNGEARLRGAYAEWQGELRALARDGDVWNAAAGEREWPNDWGLWTTNPRLMEVSVNL